MRRGDFVTIAMQALFPPATSAIYCKDTSRVVVTLVNGIELAFSPGRVKGLENAKPADLANAQIPPSGHGIHFPDIDADVYIPSLIVGTLAAKV